MTIRRTITTALLAAATAGVLASCAATAQDTPTSSASNETTVTGTLTLHQNAGTMIMTGANGTPVTQNYGTPAFTNTGNYCAGKGGYSDITAGAAVTIYNADGTIVGAGNLGAGVADSHTTHNGNTTITSAGGCAFPFTVTNVPTGSSFYQYEISHRGRITFTLGEAQSLAADLNNK